MLRFGGYLRLLLLHQFKDDVVDMQELLLGCAERAVNTVMVAEIARRRGVKNGRDG